jgi:hypothetical protein
LDGHIIKTKEVPLGELEDRKVIDVEIVTNMNWKKPSKKLTKKPKKGG